MKTKTLRVSIIILSVLLVVLAGVLLAIALKPQPEYGWKDTENGRMYLDDNGQVLTGWQLVDDNVYYFDPDTGLMQTGWLTTSSGKYFLDDNGSPITGLFPCPQGTYYFGSDCRMVTGWVEFMEGKRYFAADGIMAVGFVDIGEKRYCFEQGGIMCTGWQKLQDQRFYFGEDGSLVTRSGWLETSDGTWYLTDDGQPFTGWMQTKEARYYFLEDGMMAVGMYNIDGVNRYFSTDGNYIPLVNPWNEVPAGYSPELVTIEGHKIDSTCVNALQAMITAARNAGLTCVLNSGYRDMATQTYLWNKRYDDYISQGYSAEDAYRLTARRVAYPGTSEHQTGLAMDIVEIIKDDTLYEWFRQHAWEYGFIVRYKGEKESLTGIKDEPWHLRYVGTEVAKVCQENDWCLEEFMAQFTA